MSSVNKKEIEKFSKMANEWWDPKGKFKPLHKFNPIRIKYIRDNIMSNFKLNDSSKPLKKIDILDIGCGGGLLSEPMHRLGANVTGIDASINNIKIAKLHSKKNKLDIKYIHASPEKLKIKKKFDVILNMEIVEHVEDIDFFLKSCSKLHAKKNKLNINYICTSPEKLKIKKKFDVILNMEIVEHVEDIDFFLESCSKLLKKNGLMFVATINKTLKSYIFAIVGAEYVLRWLPIGTHEWEKFVKPAELQEIQKKNKLVLNKLDGMQFNMIKDEWRISKDTSVNYIAKFIKI